jgi:hypothetical protein
MTVFVNDLSTGRLTLLSSTTLHAPAALRR